MEKKLKSRTNTMDAVTRYCLENPLVIALVAALGISVSALVLKVQSILSLEALQESNKKGVALTKKQKKKLMVTLGSGAAAAGQAYAQKNGLLDLFNELKYVASALYRGSGIEAITKSENVYTLMSAIPEATRLPYGISDVVLELFADAIKDYKEHDKSTTIVRTTRKTQTKNLFTLVGEGMEIMRNEVLKLAEQLQVSHPDFYNTLRATAKVIDPNTHTKLRMEVLDDVTAKFIAGIRATIAETGEYAVTDATGKCMIYLPFGNYNIVFEGENYEKRTVERKVKRGSNTIKVEMAPVFDIPAEEKTIVRKELVKK
jgi:hypothetical protein